jgi:hypothetical protein
LGSGTSCLLLECAPLLDQSLLGLSRAQAFRATRLGCVHLGCASFTDPLQMFLDLFILIIGATHHRAQLGQDMLFVIGKFVLLVRVLFLSHIKDQSRLGWFARSG